MDYVLTCVRIVFHVDVTMQAYVFEAWKLVTKWSLILEGLDDFMYCAEPGRCIRGLNAEGFGCSIDFLLFAVITDYQQTAASTDDSGEVGHIM